MEKENRTVSTVKAISSGTSVGYVQEIEKDDTIVPVSHFVESAHRPSEHFEAAIDKLKRHLAIILGYSNAKKLEDVKDEVLMNIRATGISRKGEGDAEGVTITGIRRLLGKHWVSANSHFVMFMGNESYGNDLAGELYADCNNICTQALKWVDGEFRPPAQKEIEFNEPEGETPEAPHRRKRKDPVKNDPDDLKVKSKETVTA